jgi:hypothetical protein
MAGCLKTCDPCKCCVKNVHDNLTVTSARKGQWCETGPAFEDGEHALRFRVKAIDPDEKDKKKRKTTWSGLLFVRTNPDIVDNAIIYARDPNIRFLEEINVELKVWRGASINTTSCSQQASHTTLHTDTLHVSVCQCVDRSND